MLVWNQQKVRQLSPGEIWLFIVGRVLAAFGAGVLLAAYIPSADGVGWAALIVGIVLLVLAGKGMFRKPAATPGP